MFGYFRIEEIREKDNENRFERRWRNRNVNLQCFPYTRCTLSFALKYLPRRLEYLIFNPVPVDVKSQSFTVMLLIPPDISEPMATPAARVNIAVTLRIRMFEHGML